MSNCAKIYLDRLYQSIEGCSDAVALCSAYSDILQIKHDNSDLETHKNSIYVDIKCFLEEYVTMIGHEKREYGYDSIDQNKVEKFISFCPDVNQRIALFRHAYKQLSSRGFDLEADYFNDKFVTGSAILQIKHGDLLQKLHGVVSLTINNLWICLFVVAVVFVLHYIILMPCSTDDRAVFEISYSSYSDNFYVNHLLNLLSDLFGINGTLFCKPLGVIGMIINICLKLFYLIFVGGVLTDVIKKNIR